MPLRVRNSGALQRRRDTEASLPVRSLRMNSASETALDQGWLRAGMEEVLG